MGSESFEEVQALDGAALRKLVERGRPEQRVWAIWALAQETGEAAGELAWGEVSEPDPDLRCKLAAALASLGEVELLIALARHDPSTTVRASAIHHVTRIAAGTGANRDAALRAVLEAERKPGMSTSILQAVGEGAPDALVDLAVRALGAASLNIQSAALEAVLRIDTPEASEHARRWLLRHPDPRAAFDTWICAVNGLGDPARRAICTEMLAPWLVGTPVSVRAELGQRLKAPPWAAVALLVDGSDELLRFVVRRADIAIPARVLAGAILRGLHDGFVEKLTTRLERAARGRALLADIRRTFELDDAQPVLAGLTGRARELGGAWGITGAREVLDELARQHPVEHLLGLENAVARWLADDELGEPSALRVYCEIRRERRPAEPADAPVEDARAPFEALLAALGELGH